MSQVEIVALWAGLIASIASIVLSIAALTFAVLVNNRATQVNDQTIKSLQKIESAVERLSDDTRQLIKAGWDKMLGGFQGPAQGAALEEEEDGEQIASGIRQEVMAELGAGEAQKTGAPELPPPLAERVEEALNKLEQTLAAQLKYSKVRGTPSRATDLLIERIVSLSPEAQALLAVVAQSIHLTRGQYLRLNRNSATHDAIRGLRSAGLLVPLSHQGVERKDNPVYWLPPGIVRHAKAALQLVPPVPRDVMSSIEEELKKMGYLMPPEAAN